MTKEQKDLLLKDLCCRLPYCVKARYYDVCEEQECIDEIDTICLSSSSPEVGIGQYGLPIEKVKPYLFPLSSMTEEQEMEYLNTCVSQNPLCWTLDTFKWLNKNHFDYNYLIDDDLALDATGLNIY